MSAIDPTTVPVASGRMLVVLAFVAIVATTIVLRRAARAPALQRWARWFNPAVVMAWLAFIGIEALRFVAFARSGLDAGGRVAALLAVAVIAAPVARDLFAATMIGLEGRYRLGDDVRVGGHEGRIVVLGLRSVVLRAYDGSETVVPNQRFLAADVVRLNLASGEAPLEFEVEVPDGRDLEEFSAEIVEAALLSPLAAPGSLPEVFVVGTDGSRPRVRVRAYVFDRIYASRYKSDILVRLAAREPPSAATP